MSDPLNEMINYFKERPIYLVVILLVILFFYLISRIKKDNKVIKNGRCPMCGGNLIKEDRMVKCVNYPKCRYKR